MTMADNYSDIRPYNDSEVNDVTRRLTDDCFFRFAVHHVLRCLAPDWTFGERKEFLEDFRDAKSADDVQKLMLRPIDEVVRDSMTTVNISGLEELEKDKNYLFISNHRDILMDSFLIGSRLHYNGFQTPLNAFGSNLSYRYIEDLMKLNKSFVIKRDKKRNPIKNMRTQSEFIYDSIEQGKSVWIAQKEGRAKNGDDRTNPNIILMLYLASHTRGLSYNEFIEKYSIVPVSISYEYEPCIRFKAKELHKRKKQNGDYRKSRFEDLLSIREGLKGFKGSGHLAFGKPLCGDFSGKEDVALAIDGQIISNYHIWNTNTLAYNSLNDRDTPYYFDNYIKTFPKSLRNTVLDIYARPVKNKLELGKNS